MWAVVFHADVLRKDLPHIDPSAKRQILKAIEKKLPVDPAGYGEPLHKDLFGFWKLKVGAWRVLYRIQQKKVTVFIIKIGPRKDNIVYEEMLQRAHKLLQI